jgi:hypothetical protein
MNIAYVKTQGKPKFIASIKKVGNGSQRGGAGTKSELKNNSRMCCREETYPYFSTPGSSISEH